MTHVLSVLLGKGWRFMRGWRFWWWSGVERGAHDQAMQMPLSRKSARSANPNAPNQDQMQDGTETRRLMDQEHTIWP